ncbi:hypothetical protein GDO78_013769 [Eleutherodactylus coqui]|uniref:Uncharacterized protein n=1 Tax=Eleutherodactylus coqui TaxID=57060 RepID=A0A8J6B8B6_ELECQ|nr:hypothetical protein GDO78_013769 [Eleutherodactylus coqui]
MQRCKKTSNERELYCPKVEKKTEFRFGMVVIVPPRRIQSPRCLRRTANLFKKNGMQYLYSLSLSCNTLYAPHMGAHRAGNKPPYRRGDGKPENYTTFEK